MRISRWQRILFRDAWIAVVFYVALAVDAPAGAQRQSSIVLNLDGSGTTIVKPLDSGQEWTIYHGWQQNQVNGAVRYSDGGSDFLNCTPLHRTNLTLSLDCRLYNEATQQWSSEPILVDNTTSFLNGDFPNPFNSLSSIPGGYVTTIEFPGFSESYRLQILDVARSSAGVPFFIVNANPPVQGSFLFRNTDLTDGTRERTNFTLGMQTQDFCIDLDLQPGALGGTLAGTFGARQREGEGCGAIVAENRSASVQPSGELGVAGTYCEYTVDSVERCDLGTILEVGSSVCLPCAGTCRSFDGPLTVMLLEPTSAPIDCFGVRVSPFVGQSCDQSCVGRYFADFPSGGTQSVDRLAAAFAR